MDEGLRREAERLVRAAVDLSMSSGNGSTTELRTALTQLTRPATVVCVIGEYKQGKSALVNALVGADVCPVDDDLATAALTLVHAADEPRASVRIVSDGEEVVREIALGEVAAYASESGDPDVRRAVRHVEIGVAGAPVDSGLVLIDTPGVGGLDPAEQEAVLGFLPYADAALFVSDASAELSSAEVDFVQRAREVCPEIVVVLTKTDLYGEWRRIAELDRRHLGTTGRGAEVVPVSPLLSRAGGSGDGPDDESGITALRAVLHDDVQAPAVQRAAERALRRSASTVADAQADVARSLAVLTDPQIAQQRVAELEGARAELADLKAGSARWGTVLQDGFSTVRSDTDFRLRSFTRDLLREADAELGPDGDAAAEWETWVDDLRRRVAAEVQSIDAHVRHERDRVASEIAEMIGAAGVVGDDRTRDSARIERALSAEIEAPDSGDASLVASGLTAVRGVQSGVLLLGMMAQLVGAVALTPIALGVGAALGGRQLREERSKRRQRQQQEARAEVRRFLEQIQFEFGNHLQRSIADEQRSLRDGVTDEIGRRDRIVRERLVEAEAAVQDIATDRQERIADLESRRVTIESLAAAIAQLEADLGIGSEGGDGLG